MTDTIWYLIDDVTGEMKTDTKGVRNAVAGSSWIGFTERQTGIWNKDTLVFDTPPVQIEYISKRNFLDRFTDAELDALLDAVETITQVERAVEKIKLFGDISMNGRTETFLGQLETAGIIGAGRAVEIFNG